MADKVSYFPVTSKSITIDRLVDLYDDRDTPQPAFEFGQGHTIYQKPQTPGEEYRNTYVREKDLDHPTLR